MKKNLVEQEIVEASSNDKRIIVAAAGLLQTGKSNNYLTSFERRIEATK